MTIHTLIDALRELLIVLPAIFFTITVHEYFQGIMAIKLGDNTPIDTGLARFNPFHFIDKLGLISFILFQYGWSKSITIDSRNFKNPKLDYITVVLIGITANLLASFLFILLIVLYKPKPDGYIYNLFMVTYQINLKYFIINFLPLLPLAGGKTISVFYPKYQKTEIIGIVLLLLIFILNIKNPIDVIVDSLINLFI